MTGKGKSLMRSAAAAPHVVWSVLFIVAPLLFVCYYAFTDAGGSFTFENIAGLGNYANTFGLSVAFAFIATVICLVICYPLAYFICQLSDGSQKVLVMLAMLPMWMNLLIRTYSMMAILDNEGFLNKFFEAVGIGHVKILGTPGAVIFGMVYNFLPYMLLPIYSIMSKLDVRLIEAAQDLGCNQWQVITKVIFPLSVPGVISGVTMVFVPSISTFYISQKLGGGTFDLIGDAIERQFSLNRDYNTGAAISLVMMILILISIAVMNHFTDGDTENGVGGMIV